MDGLPHDETDTRMRGRRQHMLTRAYTLIEAKHQGHSDPDEDDTLEQSDSSHETRKASDRLTGEARPKDLR